ncbi:MAG: hypothetical protein GX946_00325 [Oligosphaeraceae bacterium]|nr:hypothetical protein [Oligosphaeraceae bacterium]
MRFPCIYKAALFNKVAAFLSRIKRWLGVPQKARTENDFQTRNLRVAQMANRMGKPDINSKAFDGIPFLWTGLSRFPFAQKATGAS